jgi:hypothetical protein
MDIERLAHLRNYPQGGTSEDITSLINLVEQSHLDGLNEAAAMLDEASKQSIFVFDPRTKAKIAVNSNILITAAKRIRQYAEDLKKKFAGT